MSIFTKKLMDWNLIDFIKLTAGTLGVLWAADKIYDEFQSKKDKHNDFDNNVVTAEEEETPE